MSTENKRFYITTAIDYANGPPHIGHALEKIGADVMARYHRLKREDVHFVVGMDEHGLNVLQSAQLEGVSPQELVDDLATRFEGTWTRLSLSNDDFIRTTQPRHHAAVNEMIARMQSAGDLYRGTYAGFYCVRCEAYKTEDDLEPVPAGEPDPAGLGWRCPLHPTRELSWMKEENWFFRLSAYQDRLLELLQERPEFIQPEIRRNEIQRVIEGGLEDISVSRSRLPWGVPWPEDPEHTVYVWIDALTNYLSAIGFPNEEYEKWWPAAFHVIGKDITRFHCIYWPAMLMSAKLELPRAIWAHGFLTFEGRRFSKSAGTWVDLDEALNRHGPDALRFYLIREAPWNADGDFSWSRFDERYVAELADDLGNLVSRALSMIEKYRSSMVPAGRPTELDQAIVETVVRYRAAMDANLLHQGALAAIDLARTANGFVGTRAPWKQAKDPAESNALDDTLAALARAVAVLAALLHPFMPGKMAGLAERLGLEVMPGLEELTSLDLTGRSVHRGEVLFPKDPRK